MRLLLDTHVLLWALVEPSRLDAKTQILIENADNEIAYSAASIWEIAIKAGLRRADFPFRPDEIAEAARSTPRTRSCYRVRSW